MVPALPVTHFIVSQPGLALGALEAFFDALFGFGGPGELGVGRVRTGIGQVVIGLEDVLIAVFVAINKKQLTSCQQTSNSRISDIL